MRVKSVFISRIRFKPPQEEAAVVVEHAGTGGRRFVEDFMIEARVEMQFCDVCFRALEEVLCSFRVGNAVSGPMAHQKRDPQAMGLGDGPLALLKHIKAHSNRQGTVHQGIIVVGIHHALVMAEQLCVQACRHDQVRCKFADERSRYLLGPQDWIHFYLQRRARRKDAGHFPLVGKTKAEAEHNEASHGMTQEVRLPDAKVFAQEQQELLEVAHHIRYIACRTALSVRAAVSAHIKGKQIEPVRGDCIDQIFVAANVFAKAVVEYQVAAAFHVRGNPGLPAQIDSVPAADGSCLDSVIGQLHKTDFADTLARATNLLFFDCGRRLRGVFLLMLSFSSCCRVSGAAAILWLSACTVQLRSPQAPPAFAVEGLWVGEKIGQQVSMLWIEPNPISGGDAAPYLFTYLVVVGRDLLISQQTLVITRRTGEARTSAAELLLTQKKFFNGNRRILQKPLDPDVWQAADFSAEIEDVRTEKTYNYDVLEIVDANTISGSDGTFVRATPAGTSRYPAVAVWRTSKDGSQAAGFLFPAGRLGAGSRLKMPGRDVEATISGVAGDYVSLAITKGALRPGNGLVSVDAKEDYRRPMTKEEVLEKLRRGEAVPREDLIRALGDKKQ